MAVTAIWLLVEALIIAIDSNFMINGKLAIKLESIIIMKGKV